ncbi:hypothetical protein [Streptomyces sp. NPDC006134]|uniref:hypothetical protein n=1 Tax=Streptomyces sp. NPDC006134 TaxID=3154467 RepID=UPI0033C5FEDE
MSPVPRTARRTARRHLWPRVLVLLLALLVPGAHAQAQAQAVPGAVLPGESGAPATEYDVLDTALRLPARTGRRTAAPLRPAPAPLPRPPHGAHRPAPAPAPPGPPPSPRSLRSVVLRC